MPPCGLYIRDITVTYSGSLYGPFLEPLNLYEKDPAGVLDESI